MCASLVRPKSTDQILYVRHRTRSSWRHRIRQADGGTTTTTPELARSNIDYSKWDALEDHDDPPEEKKRVPQKAAMDHPAKPRAGVSPSQLDKLRTLLLQYLEPLRSLPPASAPKNRLACNVPQSAGWRQVHDEPPIYTCDDFLSKAECDALIAEASAQQLRPSLLGSSDATAQMQTAEAARRNAVRTSSSCAPRDSPTTDVLRRRIVALTGKSLQHLEAVSVSRYTEGQQYTEHQDASRLTPAGSRPSPDDMEFMAQGGQRVATVLVYLNAVPRGGATVFPELGVEVRPKRGRCLLFFPALLDGRCDEKTLHAARPAVDVKWVAQVWVRAHADPLQAVFQSPRWPLGCSSYSDLLKLALT